MRICVSALGVVVATVVTASGALGAQGSCAHDAMRGWVDQEEICYHAHGPLSESWDINNQANQDALEGCLNKARVDYQDQRLICELRGESDYRADGLHKQSPQYKTSYDATVSRLRQQDK